MNVPEIINLIYFLTFSIWRTGLWNLNPLSTRSIILLEMEYLLGLGWGTIWLATICEIRWKWGIGFYFTTHRVLSQELLALLKWHHEPTPIVPNSIYVENTMIRGQALKNLSGSASIFVLWRNSLRFWVLLRWEMNQNFKVWLSSKKEIDSLSPRWVNLSTLLFLLFLFRIENSICSF